MNQRLTVFGQFGAFEGIGYVVDRPPASAFVVEDSQITAYVFSVRNETVPGRFGNPHVAGLFAFSLIHILIV